MKQEVYIGHSGHLSLKSDARGDRKFENLSYSRTQGNDTTHFELHSALETPQNGTRNTVPGQKIGGKPSNQRDTLRQYALVGKTVENGNSSTSVSARVGALNDDAAMKATYGFYKGMHNAAGMKGFRESPASTHGQVMAGVSVSHTHKVAEKKLGKNGKVRAGVSTVTCATVGNDKSYALAGVAAHLSLNGDAPKHAVCEGPTPRGGGTGVSAGVFVKGVAHDVTTTAAGTRPLQAYAEVAAQHRFSDNVTLRGGVQMPLTPTVHGAHRPEVPQFFVGLRFTF